MYEVTQAAIRKIKIAGSRSLYQFAKTITGAFGFSFDHAFGFYDTFGNLRDAKKAYELFVDAGEEASPAAQGVKKTKVSQAFMKPGDKMLFLFDYGHFRALRGTHHLIIGVKYGVNPIAPA